MQALLKWETCHSAREDRLIGYDTKPRPSGCWNEAALNCDALYRVVVALYVVKSDTGFDDLIVAGRYLDRYERRDGVWKMTYRSERVDWSRTTPTNDPYYELMPDSLFGSRLDDAVYDRSARYKKPNKAAQRKRAKRTQIKEMKFRPGTEEGDYQ